MTELRSPYKGLSYYSTEDADLFAARGKDALRCAKLLTGQATVLMLHGRTGCGKSSFLRAALKPLLDRADSGLWFAKGADGFRVVRSGLTPLREMAVEVFRLVTDLTAPEGPSPGDSYLRAALQGLERDDFIRLYGNDSERMFQALTRLGEAAPGTPILVIDQAEEIFTLREKREDAGATSAEAASGRVDPGRARVHYMNLLRSVAASPPGVKILISLRTEYKGLFEDELRRGLSPDGSTRLTGFHLEDLDDAGLLEAIYTPARLGAPKDGGFGDYHFRYASGVPEKIAKKLTEPDAVPMGGVLPTLQVVCSRLYWQTRRSKTATADDTWEIQMTDLDRLGKLDNQVEVHLRERLEQMFLDLPCLRESGRDGKSAEKDRTTQIDEWYRLLESLVRLQGDGRAVTRQVPESDLFAAARNLHDAAPKGLEYLKDISILRREERQGTWVWSLGHDSLGLAIQRWTIMYKQSLDPGMMMDMNSPRLAAKLTAADLFPGGRPPAMFTIAVPADKLWDHQIPLFAEQRRLSTRVGIVFREDASLTLEANASAKPATSTLTPGHILVASERAAFPPKGQRAKWTDVGVSDLFLGNGLVGPEVPGLIPLRPLEATKPAEIFEQMRVRLQRIIGYLQETKARLLSYDESAKSMMMLACRLAGVPYGLKSSQFARRVLPHGLKDELFERLIGAGQDKTVFMIGTAYGRAMASHRGYVTYFDCVDLIRLMELQANLERHGHVAAMPSDPESRGTLFRLYQKTFFHTVWQINIPAAEWRNIEHYPVVMRLAAVCYFTADYLRSFADDFVRHLYDWHATKFPPADHVSRETIRQMLHDCFQFLTFEENPRVLFDPDSRSEFSPRDSKNETLKLESTVRKIHVELTTLRKRTIDRFGELCWQLEQLERRGQDARRVKQLEEAQALREYAWSNFRIYNYYDSARLMEQALRQVQAMTDSTAAKVWESVAGPPGSE